MAPWPQYEEGHAFPQAEAEMKKVMELITAVRTRRSEMNVPPSKKAHLYIETGDTAAFEAEREAIAQAGLLLRAWRLARASPRPRAA